MMVEQGECSSSKLSDEVWAKLAPSDSRYSDVEITSDEKVICSEISLSSCEKHSWCKIIRNSDLCSATLENKSPNTILVDEAAVHKEGTIVIRNGSEIIPGSDREGFVSYRFNVMSSSEVGQRQLKISVDIEHAKCSICLNVWHDVVTVAPCLHNFCNGCFSEWLRRSQEKHSSILCPQCRAVVQFVGRNHFLRNIEEDILRADSSLKRSDEEVALLDSYASVRSNLVIGSGRKHTRKRVYSPLDEHSDGRDPQCPQCVNELVGFRCNQNTVHIQCQGCGGMMPSRSGFNVPQYCLGCDKAFCGAYWHALGINSSHSYNICNQQTLRPISEHSISRIPPLAHERNLYEQNVTESCIRQMGRSLQDLTVEWIAKLDNREIDRTRMPLSHAEMITAGTRVCIGCYEKLVSFLLYWFRISIPKYLLPPAVANREDCWYGYACRTQHHSEEHARKRNHVCRPTRGPNF